MTTRLHSSETLLNGMNAVKCDGVVPADRKRELQEKILVAWPSGLGLGMCVTLQGFQRFCSLS